ncbi:hypothetical protein ES319_D13G188800v1 [Gossypium barbadense]|uniref:Uncharacterized protein n=1 Tax=Gossypium barbadense TaxID=3634 RepID=A0A5J5NNX0_GOSBA|nr:hypothetical protein ES319_D13G188800v1 [Gossypium barbadense]
MPLLVLLPSPPPVARQWCRRWECYGGWYGGAGATAGGGLGRAGRPPPLQVQLALVAARRTKM